jgi:hypothetical protein
MLIPSVELAPEITIGSEPKALTAPVKNITATVV